MSLQTFQKLSLLFATVGIVATISYAIIVLVDYIKIKKKRKL